MERRDLYQDDLTEERYPSPAVRNDAVATQTLDPDASADDGNDRPMPRDNGRGQAALGYPGGVPGGVAHDPEASTGTGDEADDDDGDEGDDEDDDESEDLDD